MGRGKRNGRTGTLLLSDGERSSHTAPEISAELLEALHTRELTVQMNGKVKARFRAPVDIDEDEAVKLALAALHEKIPDLADSVPQRTIMAGRVINFVF